MFVKCTNFCQKFNPLHQFFLTFNLINIKLLQFILLFLLGVVFIFEIGINLIENHIGQRNLQVKAFTHDVLLSFLVLEILGKLVPTILLHQLGLDWF